MSEKSVAKPGEVPCTECGRPTAAKCPACHDPVCPTCMDDHMQIHGDVEDLNEKPAENDDGLVEGTPDELGL